MDRPVEFYSEGSKIAGRLYLPDGVRAGRVPGVVLCHGFSCIKEVILPDYAQRFAAAGFAALAFDYRGFGESEGERGRLIWRDQVQDIRNALTFMETLEQVDPERLGLWGTSYGGANVMYTAGIDDRARAIVSQVAFCGSRPGSGAGDERATMMREVIKNERRQRVLTGQSTMVEPLQILSDPDSTAFFTAAMERVPALRTKISMETLEATMEYQPGDMVPRIAPRALLLLAAGEDIVTAPEGMRAMYGLAGEPRKYIEYEGLRHYEIYSGEPLDRSANDAIAWFKEWLSRA